jgi:hypothetical protein
MTRTLDAETVFKVKDFIDRNPKCTCTQIIKGINLPEYKFDALDRWLCEEVAYNGLSCYKYANCVLVYSYDVKLSRDSKFLSV